MPVAAASTDAASSCLQAFLTAVMQTYARQHKLPLDVMKFRTDITTKSVEQISEPAPVGCYIHGEAPAGADCRRLLQLLPANR